jgi:peptidoglycan/LPS O-acetylase OafA/YrhL
MLVLLATVVASRYLLPPVEVSLLRGDALAALAYVANWRMIFRGSDYFTQTAAPSPLQHTWSLGIEEQFYLVWPLLVAGLLVWLTWRRARGTLLAICLIGSAASAFAAAALYHPDNVNRAYFGTDSRAQALLVGAALAALLARSGRAAGRAARAASGFIGRAAVPVTRRPSALGEADGSFIPGFVGGAFVTRPAPATTPTPPAPAVDRAGGRWHPIVGLGALIGAATVGLLWTRAHGTDAWLYHGGLTAGAIAVALVIAHAVISPGSPTSRLLSLAPLVFLGRISYGVYLWHWPLFQFVNGEQTGLSGLPLLVLRIGLTLAISILSFYLLEQPIRQGRWLKTRTRPAPRRAWRLHPVGYAIVAAAITAGVTVAATSVPAASSQLGTGRPIVLPSLSARPGGVVPPMQRPGRVPGSAPRVDFFGDSVSWTIGTYLPAHPGLTVHVPAMEGCGITVLPDILEQGTPHTNYPQCVNWTVHWRAGVTSDDPDVAVILLNRWEMMDRKLDGVYQHVGEAPFDAYLLGQLDQAIAIVRARGAHVVLLTAAYTHRYETPSGGLYPEDQPARVDAWNALLQTEAAKDPGDITILDLNKLVCPNGVFTWTINGLQVRSDGLHFTPAGVQQIIAPWLLPQLASIAETGAA